MYEEQSKWVTGFSATFSANPTETTMKDHEKKEATFWNIRLSHGIGDF